MSLPPAPIEKAHPVRNWSRRQGARLLKEKAAREARAFDGDPRVAVRWPWSRRDPAGRQVLRAFIQINILPKPN